MVENRPRLTEVEVVVVFVPVFACVKKKENFSGAGSPGIVVDVVVVANDRNGAGVVVVESVDTDVAVADPDDFDVVIMLNDDSIEVEEVALRWLLETQIDQKIGSDGQPGSR